MPGKPLLFTVLIAAVLPIEGRATSENRPTIITYNPSKFAPPTMVYQQVKGVLSVKNGCVVLRREKSTTVLLNFRQPVKIGKRNGAYYIDHKGRRHELGHIVTLTGQMGSRWPNAFARSRGVPAACRGFAVFAVL